MVTLDMTVHRHDFRSLGGDYLRAGLGLALTSGPLVLVPVHAVLAWMFGAVGVLMVIHGLRTIWRHLAVIECGDDVLVFRAPVTRRLAWSDLGELRLRYFSTRRDRDRGWMQLILKGDGVALRIDSTLPGFEDIVRRALKAAAAADLPLSGATRRNLESLGLPAGGGNSGKAEPTGEYAGR